MSSIILLSRYLSTVLKVVGSNAVPVLDTSSVVYKTAMYYHLYLFIHIHPT